LYAQKIASGEIDPIAINFNEFIKQLYISDISNGKIDPSKISFEAFARNIKQANNVPSVSAVKEDIEDRQSITDETTINNSTAVPVMGLDNNKSALEKGDKIKNENIDIKDVIEELKQIYSDHEKFDEMMNDLGENNYLNYWADNLCNEDMGKNLDMAKKLYKLQEKVCESSSDYAGLANSVMDADKLNDKEWGRRLLEKALEISEYVSDIRTVAESVAGEYALNDKAWGKEIYEKVIQKADEFADIKDLADSIESYMGDKAWASELYKQAEGKLTNDLGDYLSLIHATYRTLDDKQWSTRLIKKALKAFEIAEDKFEFAGFGSNILDLIDYVIDEYLLNDKEAAKKLFAFMMKYQGVIDLIDAGRKALEVYDRDSYSIDYAKQCARKAEEYLEEGYYIDLYYFYDAIEDNVLKQKYFDKYQEEMREDSENGYGGEELFDGSSSVDLDEIDFDDYENVRNVARIRLQFLYDAVVDYLEEGQEEELREVSSEKISEFYSELSDKLGGNIEETVLYVNIDAEGPDDETKSGFGIDEINDFNPDILTMYVVLTKAIPRDIMDQICLSMYDYSFTLESLNEEGDLIYQYYSNGEHDSGYYMQGAEEYYVNAEMDNYNFAKQKLNVE
jgi:hypothetical protein